MDRRAALGLAASLPIAGLAANRAEACSIRVGSAEEIAQRLPDISRLFRTRFDRDELTFLGAFYGPRNSNGLSVSDEVMRRYIAAAGDREPARLYNSVFTDPGSSKVLQSITGIGERVMVWVSEQGAGGIGPDCSNLPILHLFLVGYEMNRPATLRLIESERWSGYGSVVNWSV